MSIWILVAESSRAKLFSAANSKSPINEIEDIAHPEGRMHEGDLVSDKPGSDGGSMGQGRHIFDDKVSAREQEVKRFAKSLATRLESARNDGSFQKLVLIAPAAFLGALRSELGKDVMNLVSREVDKNLIQQPTENFRQYV
jgi:protein required for attachment to host cells